MFKDAYDEIFQNKSKILIVFSHPDDAEIYAGGTIARLVKDGKEVRIVKMTLGNKGSRQEKISEQDLSSTRKDEDLKSMEILGINQKNNIYLNLPDGGLENSMIEVELLVRQVREFKPDLIITHNPEDVIIRFDKNVNWVNHRDHRNTGKSVVDASYPYSRDILFFSDHFENPYLQSHTSTEFLFVDYYEHQDTICIDITDSIETRIEAIKSHSSQYSIEEATSTTDFFTKIDDSGKRFERFRYVVAD